MEDAKLTETVVVYEKLNASTGATAINRIKVLEIIEGFGGSAGLKDIANHMGVSTAATLGYLNWLVKAGYVNKTSEKPVKYTLTESGKSTITKPKTTSTSEIPAVDTPSTSTTVSTPTTPPKVGFWAKLARFFGGK